MEFRNLTPFDALCYSALAPDDQEHRVIAMKVAYRLSVDPQTPGRLQPQLLDAEPLPLCTADTFYGEPGQSSTREESDLAPYKPRCDVLLRGHAYAPQGRPHAQWMSRLRVSLPLPLEPPPEIPLPYGLAPNMPPSFEQLEQWRRAQAHALRLHAERPTHRVLLDKSLRVSGPRQFSQARLRGDWRVGEAQPVSGVPLRWEHAFGGHAQVADRERDPTLAPGWRLNEVCFSNPLGCGWFDARQFDLAGPDELQSPEGTPVPQFEWPDAPVLQPLLARNPEPPVDAAGMATVAAGYGMQPAGFGARGRAWAPRLALAGSYDWQWLNQRWPGLPLDFDFGYWNSAPVDQQVEHLAPDARLEVWNLTDPALSADGYACCDLPGHRPYVLVRMQDGGLLPLPLLTDTVLWDTDTATLSLTHRVSLPRDWPVRAIEARFESDPAAPLVRWPATETAGG
ncbi:DUF2169 family type VI secretion system accessory protein [Xanthomonas maliensis]|uniref:DUF2169 family type VI secretion system accessory protein n=1 Tax=Xanthomonas maliensis TaxID=1321368 RepID=UPI0003A7A814|nr:DUF2169 domain-containing protein [Xanthomonas maliensis]KAB7762604.1 DUF2169 domain-containing protein [Xanthomonas maliensis]